MPWSETPILETNRLRLRQLELQDAQELFRLRSDEAVMRWVDRPLARSLNDAVKTIATIKEQQQQRQALFWAITTPEIGQMIGCICFVGIEHAHARAEIGYLLGTAHQGLGYMTEALNRIVDFGFVDLGLHKITASVSTYNQASLRVLQRNGFLHEGVFKQHYFWNGHFFDFVMLARFSPKASEAMAQAQRYPCTSFHR